MVKKKWQEPPDWFQRFTEMRSSLWLRPTLTEEATHQLLGAVSSDSAAASYFWHLFVQTYSYPHEEYVTKASDYELVNILFHSVEIRVAIETFLPRTLPIEPPEAAPHVRLWSYVQAWALSCCASLVENPKAPLEETFAPIYLIAKFLAAGPLAEAEIRRRGVRHVGYHAAMLLLIAVVLDEGCTDKALLDQDAEQALKVLERAARGVRPGIPLEKEEWRAELGRVLPEEIRGQIFETLTHKYPGLDTRELLARSLKGELDIAPRAIRDDLAKSVARERREIPILIRERPAGEDAESPRSWEDALPSREFNPEEAACFQALLTRLRDDPRCRRLLQAMQGAETQKEIAARLGVEERTVRNWRAKLRELLELPG